MKEEKKEPEYLSDVFNGSIALEGICILVISVFQVSDKRALYLVDDCFCITSGLFLLPMVFAFLYISRTKSIIFRKIADLTLGIAIFAMIVSGFVLMYEM